MDSFGVRGGNIPIHTISSTSAGRISTQVFKPCSAPSQNTAKTSTRFIAPYSIIATVISGTIKSVTLIYLTAVAAVMLGSSETTFYTIAVYFSAVKVRKTRYAVPAALTADLTAWIVCGVTVYYSLPSIR